MRERGAREYVMYWKEMIESGDVSFPMTVLHTNALHNKQSGESDPQRPSCDVKPPICQSVSDYVSESSPRHLV